MGKHIPVYGIVDVSKHKIISVEGKKLLGECLRCGKCCSLGSVCEHLKEEIVNDKPTKYCEIYFQRPVSCALYPRPQDPKVEGCGFYYEE